MDRLETPTEESYQRHAGVSTRPTFHSLSPCLQLARAGTVGRPGAKLLLEVSERVRTLTQAYFSPERPLHLSFTHLVCRSAIDGNHQGTPSCLPNLFPSTLQTVPYQPHWERRASLLTCHPEAKGIWVG